MTLPFEHSSAFQAASRTHKPNSRKSQHHHKRSAASSVVFVFGKMHDDASVRKSNQSELEKMASEKIEKKTRHV